MSMMTTPKKSAGTRRAMTFAMALSMALGCFPTQEIASAEEAATEAQHDQTLQSLGLDPNKFDYDELFGEGDYAEEEEKPQQTSREGSAGADAEPVDIEPDAYAPDEAAFADDGGDEDEQTEPLHITVRLRANGATDGDDEEPDDIDFDVVEDSEWEFPENTFTREDHEFAGWVTAEGYDEAAEAYERMLSGGQQPKRSLTERIRSSSPTVRRWRKTCSSR